MGHSTSPAYLVFDVETVPDGELIRRTRYPKDQLSAEEAVERYRTELRNGTDGRSDFVPLTYCYPIAVCVARVSADFCLQAITSLDSPEFRPAELVADFWRGLAHYNATLVSFNGRGFDIPILEMAAFRFGVSVPGHFTERFGRRYRYGTAHLDLQDWLSNHGAIRMHGGLNLLSKLLGKPGKMDVSGGDVWEMFRAGKVREINDYCMFDVLDTYFVFLRTRVMVGELDLPTEQSLMSEARQWISGRVSEHPHLQHYLDNWGDWAPWISATSEPG